MNRSILPAVAPSVRYQIDRLFDRSIRPQYPNPGSGRQGHGGSTRLGDPRAVPPAGVVALQHRGLTLAADAVIMRGLIECQSRVTLC